MRHIRRRFALASMIVLLVATTGSAETITVNGGDQVLIGTITYNGMGLPGDSASAQFYIGSLSTTLNGSTFDTYCIDLNHTFSPPASWDVNAQATFDSTQNDTDAANQGGSTISVTGSYQQLAYLIDKYGPGATTPDTAAALQIALWTVEYGSGVSVGLTSDQATVNSLVSSYLADVNSASVSTLDLAAATFFVATDPTSSHQDLIGLIPGQSDPFTSVPEPSSLAMIAIGLGVVALRSRKSRRTS